MTPSSFICAAKIIERGFYMQTKPIRRSGLFLLELMIAILLFSLASTFCMLFFVKSDTLERQSYDLNHAVTASSSVAELLRYQKDPIASLEKHFPLGKQTEEGFVIYYNKSWRPCASFEAEYLLNAAISEENSVITGQINISKNEQSLYSLTIKKYWPEEETL